MPDFSEVISWFGLHKLSRGWCLPLSQNCLDLSSGENKQLKEFKIGNHFKKTVTLPFRVEVACVCAQELLILHLFSETLL